jgi:HK97 family phage prohead protease
MSATTNDATSAAPELVNAIIHRTFAADLTPGDGRTVDVRIIPYGEQIEHDDGLGGLPIGMPYTEEWAAGCFRHQERAANRILANGEHEQGVGGIVGHGIALREASDGFYGSFKIHETPDGDKALILINDGVWNSISLEARPVKTLRTAAGVVRRVKAHLEAIAFTRFGAYAGAQVLAVREQGLTIEDEVDPIADELRPAPMDPELVERCRRLGIELPERYEAHPDATDTPADEAGTSGNGTRQDDQTTQEVNP